MLELLKLPKKEVDELRKKKDLLEVKFKNITKVLKMIYMIKINMSSFSVLIKSARKHFFLGLLWITQNR